MVKAIIRTGKIEITNDKYYLSYQLEDKELMIDYKIEELFRKNHSIPLHTMVSQEGKTIKGYRLLDIVGNLKLGALQWLASLGITKIIEDGLDKGIVEDKKELGDFDRLILQALDYNPKKHEKK